MRATKSAGPAEVEMLRPESADAPGVLRVGGAYYDYTSGPLGYAVERLSTGSIYHVRVAGGRPVACQCGDWKFRHPAGGCRHMRGVEAAMAAW